MEILVVLFILVCAFAGGPQSRGSVNNPKDDEIKELKAVRDELIRIKNKHD